MAYNLKVPLWPTLLLIRPYAYSLLTVYTSLSAAIAYNRSVTVSVMNAACYNDVVKCQLVHDFLVYEFWCHVRLLQLSALMITEG